MSTFNKYRVKGAYHYDWYETEEWYKYLVDRCVDFCQGKTVDAGCGDGVLLSKLPDGSIGLDNDDDALELCSGLSTAKVDLDEVDYIDGEYDYVASINAIEHLNNPQSILNLVRHAKKGAIIITIDYQGGSIGEDHKFEWTLQELTDFFKEFNPQPFRYKNTEWIGVEITK